MTNQEAIKILKGTIKKPNTKDGYLGQALTMGIEALERQKTGHWIETDLYIYECSECHIGTSVGSKDNFCPNCGAKMEGENRSEIYN